MLNLPSESKIIKIPVKDLNFDPDNPRISNDIDKSNDEDVIEYLLTNANIDDLMKSILSQGYFEGEPLLVCPLKNSDQYIVVEGNRRLGALKLINGFPPPRKENTIKAILSEGNREISKVPCIVYEKREDILDYLGYRHITGIKEWDHLAKARYLKQLYEKTVSNSKSNDLNDVEIYKLLARNIGSKYPSVESLLRGLKVLNFADDNNILDEIGKRPNDIPFSLLTTALNDNNIKNYVVLDKSSAISDTNLNTSTVRNLLSWLYGDKTKNKIVKESREIRKLAKVVANSDSLNYLIKHENDSDILENSYALAGGLIDGFEENLNKINSILSSSQNLLNLVNKELTEQHLKDLEEIQTKIKILYGSVKSFVVEED